MARRSQGRGAVAAFGLLVLFAGLVGGGVLWFLSAREANRAAEEFARAAPGCTTTLTFTDPGEYYVYEELSGVPDGVAGCVPTASEGSRFAFVINDPDGDELEVELDDSISYDLDAGAATSVGRIDIVQPGAYEISVVGNDPAVVAAIGGDPDERVPTLRNAAIAAAAVGFVVGMLLLMLSGRRSRKAATFDSPLDPGWGVTERDHARRAAADDAAWPPTAPTIGGQVPVNPHDPEGRRVAQLDRAAGDGGPTPTLPGDLTPPTGIDRPDAPADGSDPDGPAAVTAPDDVETSAEPASESVGDRFTDERPSDRPSDEAMGEASADPQEAGDVPDGAREHEDSLASDTTPPFGAPTGDEPAEHANWAPPEDDAQESPPERAAD